MEIDKAKLQIETEGDFAHLLNQLLSNYKLLRIFSQEDFVLDTVDHTLFNAGLSLTIRKARENHPTPDTHEPTVSVILKETKTEDSLPFLKLHEREEICRHADVKAVLNGAELGQFPTHLAIFRDIKGRFPTEKIHAIGSFSNTRHSFKLDDDVPLFEADRCTFYPMRSQAFFCMFECVERVINKCLGFLKHIDVHFCVPLLPKTSLFFYAAEQGATQGGGGPVQQYQSPRISDNVVQTTEVASILTTFNQDTNFGDRPLTRQLPKLVPGRLAVQSPQPISMGFTEGPHQMQNSDDRRQSSSSSNHPPINGSSRSMSAHYTGTTSVALPPLSSATYPSSFVEPPTSSPLATYSLTTNASHFPPQSYRPQEPPIAPAASSRYHPYLGGPDPSSPGNGSLRSATVPAHSHQPQPQPLATTTQTSASYSNPATPAAVGGAGQGGNFVEVQKAKKKEAAARYRKRKNEEMQELHDTITKLNSRIHELETDKRVLETQVKMLKEQLQQKFYVPNGSDAK